MPVAQLVVVGNGANIEKTSNRRMSMNPTDTTLSPTLPGELSLEDLSAVSGGGPKDWAFVVIGYVFGKVADAVWDSMKDMPVPAERPNPDSGGQWG
jgi:hypothetical protein